MGGTHAGDGRDGFNKTHEEHQSFIRHTAEKFHLTKSQGSLTRKTVRSSGAAGSYDGAANAACPRASSAAIQYWPKLFAGRPLHRLAEEHSRQQ